MQSTRLAPLALWAWPWPLILEFLGSVKVAIGGSPWVVGCRLSNGSAGEGKHRPLSHGRKGHGQLRVALSYTAFSPYGPALR